MSTMILTEKELRKYFYYSFLKKDMPNAFNSNKNIKKLQHKNSLIKEQSNPPTASAKQRQNKKNITVVISSKSDFTPFFGDFIQQTQELSTGQRFGKETLSSAWFYISKDIFTISDIINSHPNKEHIIPLLTNGGKGNNIITPELINKIKFKITQNEMVLEIPLIITLSDKNELPVGDRIILGDRSSALTAESSISPVYDILLACFKSLKNAYLFNIVGNTPGALEFWNRIKFNFTGVLKDRLVTPYDLERVGRDSKIGDSKGVHNSSVLINKAIQYAEVFQKSYNTLTLAVMTAPDEITPQKYIEKETADNKSIDFNTGLFEKFLQKKRKKDTTPGDFGIPQGLLAWETDTSFFDFFYGQFDSMQGWVDLTNFISTLKSGTQGHMGWRILSVGTSLLSFQNRWRYITFLQQESDKLNRFITEIQKGRISPKTQKEMNEYIKALADEGIEIDNIDDALEKLHEVIIWERVYYILDATGWLDVAVTGAKVGILKVFDTLSSTERKIRFQIPVKPKLGQDGKPITREVDVFDKDGKQVFNADGTPLKKEQIVFEEVKVRDVRIDPNDPKYQISQSTEGGDSFYLIYSCMSPQTDDVFKAMIEDVSDISSEFFAGNYKKLNQTVTVDGKQMTVLDELAQRYKEWKVLPGKPVYLNSINMNLAEGDEFLVLFRLLGIADDAATFKYMDDFKKQKLQLLFDSKINTLTSKYFSKDFFTSAGSLTEGQKFVMNYILKKYPIEIKGAQTIRISSVDDLAKMPDITFNANKDAIINNLKSRFEPVQLKTYATKQLDDVMTGIPDRSKFMNNGKFDATAYGNAVREYSENIKQARVTTLDYLYDISISSQHSVELQAVMGDEVIREQLSLLKNCDQQLVAGNLDINEESLTVIFRVMKEYNARNELFFRYQRLGKYGDNAHDIGSIDKAEVIEDLLTSGAQSIDSNLTVKKVDKKVKNKAGEEIQIKVDDPTPVRLPEGPSDVKMSTNEKVRKYKEKVKGEFNLPKDNDLITNVKQYNAKTATNTIDASELGARTQVYEKMNVNLEKATSQFTEGLEAQKSVVSNLIRIFDEIKGNQTISEPVKKLAAKYSDELATMQKNLDDTTTKLSTTSYYDSKGAARTPVGNLAYTAGTGAAKQYLFASKGHGMGGLIGNPFDVRNRQIYMLGSIYSRCSEFQGTFSFAEFSIESNLGVLKNITNNLSIAANQFITRPIILEGKALQETFLNLVKEIKAVFGQGTLAIEKADLVGAKNAFAKVGSLLNQFLSAEGQILKFAKLDSTGSFGTVWNLTKSVYNFVVAAVRAWQIPIKFYIENPVITDAAVDMYFIHRELTNSIIGSSEFRAVTEMKLSEYINVYNVFLPKISMAVLFNGKKAQISALNEIMNNGLDVWRTTTMKTLLSYKRTLEYNRARLLQEKQNKVLKDLNAGLRATKKLGDSPAQQQAIDVLYEAQQEQNSTAAYDEMLNNINNINDIPISLNNIKDDSNYNSFLKKWSDGGNNLPKYLESTKFPASYYQLDKSAKLNRSDLALITILSAFSNNIPKQNEISPKDIPADVNKAVIEFIQQRIKEIPQITDFEESQNQLNSNSYQLLLNVILEYKNPNVNSSQRRRKSENNTIGEVIKSRYPSDNASDKLSAMLLNNLFWENSRKTFKLSKVFADDLKTKNNPLTNNFVTELTGHLKLANEKSKMISKEIFSMNVSLYTNVKEKDPATNKESSVKKYVTQNYGLMELFKTTAPHFNTIYSYSDRTKNIDIFLNSLRNVKLESVHNSDKITSSRYSYISSLKEKVSDDISYGQFREKMLFLDFINLFKETRWYEKIKNDPHFLKVIDQQILYIDRGFSGIVQDSDLSNRFRFSTNVTEILKQIKTDAEGVILSEDSEQSAKNLKQDITHIVKQQFFSETSQKIADILTDIWKPHFMINQFYLLQDAKQPNLKILNPTDLGKEYLLKFLKCVRLIKFVLLADDIFKKIKSVGSIENDNFLDVISILTGGVNDLNLKDEKFSDLSKNSEANIIQNASLKNLESVFSYNRNDTRNVRGATLRAQKAIKINSDYLNLEPDNDYLVKSYFDPDEGLSNIISVHTHKMLATNDIEGGAVKGTVDFLLKASAEEILGLNEVTKQVQSYISWTSDILSSISDKGIMAAKTVKKGYNWVFKEMNENKKRRPLLEGFADNLNSGDNNIEMQQPSNLINQNNDVKTQDTQIPLNNEKPVIKKKRENNNSSQSLNSAASNIAAALKLEDPKFRQKMLTELFREDLDVNYSLASLLKKESIQKIFENIEISKKYIDELNLQNNNEIKNSLRQINILEKNRSKTEEILNDLNLKILENDENFKQLMSFSVADYAIYESEAIDNIKKETGVNSKFYKAFKKKKNFLVSLDTNADPTQEKDFDIDKNKRSLVLAEKYLEEINKIFNLSKKNRQINTEMINSQIYDFIEDLYKNAEDKDVKAEGEDYLEFLKKFIQREITEINVNSNIIGYQINSKTSNIEKLILLGDIKDLVENEFINEFFINLPVIYEVNLNSLYQKKPDLIFNEEFLEEKETALKQSSFNYKYYQIISENNSLSTFFVENKILNMNFINKIFEV